MVSFDILNMDLFVFICVVILSSIIISIYMIIKPETTTPFNFNPFPQQSPVSLPDPGRPTDNCWNKLTTCDKNGECSACSLDEYECKDVSKEQADAGFYHFNGITIKTPGKYCLPKDQNPQPCNTWTGRYLWVFDDEYCSKVNGKSQCWKCECLYPTLFGDSSTGCTAKFACQNDSVYSLSLEQPQNSLKATQCSKFSPDTTWDPTLPDINPSTDLYNYTPYDQDENKNPWFSCDCSQSLNDQNYSQLPGDPYTCHLSPCYKSMGYSSSEMQVNESCGVNTASCDCKNTNTIIADKGNFKGTCVLIENSCGKYGYNNKEQKCACTPPAWERECKNVNTGVNIDKPDLPDCILPFNALGSECYDPCQGITCLNGTICISCGPDSYKENPVCSLTDKKDQVHAQCDCRTADIKPGKPFVGFSGQTCNNTCLGDGKSLRVKQYGTSATKHYDCNCCCSLTEKKVHHWFEYHTYCDGNFVSSKGPDSKCLPPKSCPYKE